MSFSLNELKRLINLVTKQEKPKIPISERDNFVVSVEIKASYKLALTPPDPLPFVITETKKSQGGETTITRYYPTTYLKELGDAN